VRDPPQSVTCGRTAFAHCVRSYGALQVYADALGDASRWHDEAGKRPSPVIPTPGC